MMHVQLRPYDPSTDLERCLAIWRTASEQAHSFLGREAILSDEELVRDRYMPMADIVVAERQGEIAGFIALLGGLIGGLFVSPAQHRTGIGRILVEDAARRAGALEVEVYRENPRALAFYRAIGFHEVGERPLDELGRAHPLVAMKREPDQSRLPSAHRRASSARRDMESAEMDDLKTRMDVASDLRRARDIIDESRKRLRALPEDERPVDPVRAAKTLDEAFLVLDAAIDEIEA